MKNVLILFFAFLIFSCKSQQSNIGEEIGLDKEQDVINLVIDNWHGSASNADFEAYFKAMSNKSKFIGTDASENWSKEEFKKFSKPFFDNGKAWNFNVIERNVYIGSMPSYAWFDELLETWMGVCRGSGVLIKQDGEWKISHYVLSVTIPNNKMNKVIELTKQHDSIFILNSKKAIH